VIDCGAGPSGEPSAARVIPALTASQLTPTAVELQTHPARLLVRFETIDAAAEQQAEAAQRLAEANGARASVVAGAEEAALWDAHAQRPWSGAGAVLKVTLMPADVASTVAWLDDTLRDAKWEAIGRAGVGALLVRVDADAERQARLIADLRGRLSSGRGSVVLLRAGDDLKRAAGVWGPPGDALPLMRAIKQQFDPYGLLNRGRGPFGI
jgi:glycolate oxidase FAD binding subunit